MSVYLYDIPKKIKLKEIDGEETLLIKAQDVLRLINKISDLEQKISIANTSEYEMRKLVNSFKNITRVYV